MRFHGWRCFMFRWIGVSTICFILIRGHSSHAWARYHFMAFFENTNCEQILMRIMVCSNREANVLIHKHSLTVDRSRCVYHLINVIPICVHVCVGRLLACPFADYIKMVNFHWRVDRWLLLAESVINSRKIRNMDKITKKYSHKYQISSHKYGYAKAINCI